MPDQSARTAIVALGELVVDWVCMDKGAGPLHTGGFWRCIGGNATNVAVGLQRLGSEARLVAKVGEDIHEKYLRRCLEAEGVDLRHLIVDPRYPTAQCYCFWDREDDYSYYNFPEPHAADMLSADELKPEMFAHASAMHTTGISLMLEPRRSAVFRAIEMARDLGLVFSFDATFATDRSHESEADLHAMRSADILKLNFYELAYWLKVLCGESLASCDISGTAGPAVKDEISRAAAKIVDQFEPALLAVTLGEHGCLLVTAGGSTFCPALKVETVAAIGAGDGFVAGLLHILDRHPPSARGADNDGASRTGLSLDSLRSLTTDQLFECGMFANAVGALVTTTSGASDGLPTTAAVNAVLSAQMSKIKR
jgi:fructokinase